MEQNARFLNDLCCIAQEAGEAILPYFRQPVEIAQKADRTPVTQADLAAHRVIVDGLLQLAPEIPIISEESEQHRLPPDATRFWLVDPLDGTKSFIRGEGTFTVNIALVEARVPVLGIITIPVERALYAGRVGGSAFRQIADGPRETLTTRPTPAEGLTALLSHSHRDAKTDAYIATLPVAQRMSAASSLKFCRIAEGKADLYPRFGPTMEWDTAAGHAILSAAGGRVETPGGAPFTYGKPEFRNGAFVAWGR